MMHPDQAAWFRYSPWPLSAHPIERMSDALDTPEVSASLLRDEREGRYPDTALRALHTAGLGKFLVDGSGGPAGASYPEVTALICMLAQRSGSLGITVGVNVLALLPIYLAADPALSADVFAGVRAGQFLSLLLTELTSGSDLLGGQLTAVPVRDGNQEISRYCLTGAKDLINGGTHHDLLVTLARTRCDRLSDRRSPMEEMGDFTLFVVPRGDATVTADRWRTLPAPAADIAGVSFVDAIVGVDRVIGREGEGFPIIRRTLTCSRGGIAALSSGTISRARQLASVYAREKFLYGRPIAALLPIAEHLLALEALDRLVAAISIHAVAAVNMLGPGAAAATAAAKSAGCALAEEGVREGARILGARALLADLPYAQLSRDILLYSVFDGTSHVVEEELATHVEREARRRDQKRQPGHSLSSLQNLYRHPLNPMAKHMRSTRDNWTLALPETFLELSELAGVPLDIIAACAVSLLEVVTSFQAQGLWRAGAFRHDIAKAYALLECLAAGAILIDPVRRGLLGLPASKEPTDQDEMVWSYAVGMLGARVLNVLMAVATITGSELPVGSPIHALGGFETCLRACLDMQTEAKRAWHTKLTCNSN
ncbi:alkylation response protein AidB-like acyl-CoA dehydrogenase [Sphingobium subterraneum]|uniref:Alkylation response protein AidB-like acyl-CoA dehydrogenase n=2 Tax=Sphingobium subterraneum TaxID=627688 RepID=A0A841IXK6_9SPHN|nr:alkylation response protein AidB-like acyl-CoA dehydrogenase [Sphingobium subterraneum]